MPKPVMFPQPAKPLRDGASNGTGSLRKTAATMVAAVFCLGLVNLSAFAADQTATGTAANPDSADLAPASDSSQGSLLSDAASLSGKPVLDALAAWLKSSQGLVLSYDDLQPGPAPDSFTLTGFDLRPAAGTDYRQARLSIPQLEIHGLRIDGAALKISLLAIPEPVILTWQSAQAPTAPESRLSLDGVQVADLSFPLSQNLASIDGITNLLTSMELGELQITLADYDDGSGSRQMHLKGLSSLSLIRGRLGRLTVQEANATSSLFNTDSTLNLTDLSIHGLQAGSLLSLRGRDDLLLADAFHAGSLALSAKSGSTATSGASGTSGSLKDLRIGDLQLSGLRPAKPEKGKPVHVPSLLERLKAGRLAADDLSLSSAGTTSRIRHFRAEEFGLSGAERLLLEHFGFHRADSGTQLSLERLAARDVALPATQDLARFNSKQAPNLSDLLTLAPKPGAFSIDDLKLSLPSGSTTTADSKSNAGSEPLTVSFDYGEWDGTYSLGELPDAGTLTVTRLSLPLAVLGRTDMASLLQQNPSGPADATKPDLARPPGLIVNQRLGFHWEQDGSLIVSPFHVELAGVAALDLGLEFSDVPPLLFAGSGGALLGAAATKLDGGRLQLTSEPVIGRYFGDKAEEAGVPVADLARLLAAKLRPSLNGLFSADFSAKIEDLLAALITAPQTRTIRMTPPTPLPLLQLYGSWQNEPKRLDDVLGLTVAPVH